MCKVIGKSNERSLCKLSKSEILQLYSIIRVAMETTKTSYFTFQSKSFSSIFFTWHVLACELQPFSCHGLAKYISSQTAKTVFSHLNYNLHSRRLEVMGSRKNGAREGNTPLPIPSRAFFFPAPLLPSACYAGYLIYNYNQPLAAINRLLAALYSASIENKRNPNCKRLLSKTVWK